MYVYFYWFSGTIWSKNLTPYLPLVEPLLDPYIEKTPYIFFYKMLVIRSMTWKYSYVISALFIHEFWIFYKKNSVFFSYVDL